MTRTAGSFRRLSGVSCLVWCLLASACGEARPILVSPETMPTVAVSNVEVSPLPVRPPKIERGFSVADRIERLPSAAVGTSESATSAQPVGLWVPDLGIENAPIRSVGVEPNGEMEIPPGDEIGWYRYGPSPGEPGSAVLAAHVAYDGRDGVFRYLTELEPGARLHVQFDDGTASEFEVVSRAQYDKDELPFDAIFARDGFPSIALITCGGSFNTSLSSYDDNIVAYAVPVTA